ncbi:hypothetical protein AMES_4117 [Amycolatopsis mediterranei S699]|uniref:Uncharacterized protein n=2 Tax=Amycolatopsis mediterranei TaxID=33910 RepID=A0A0H3D6I0_AMYMU|nr:hypothetical protein [Amycolatopsis mediterranei]ADJ45942.1 hypothetical protein AMED_4165 [Amycolatopsis mediterranei U32]AEK42723.1 hypothetical protein RAM_21215 [Amycolatopsis mediterranei S699]AFO77653.1 hypothetical protein AMES_4117 [Amycolatopsis mediterranei S699]AGT84781.1 hypothetical protein B737_4117 [Amycolatopsis mediterranei RB]KDO05476.1 hypothetical protein DV26_38220 [Amycolatopsis mediterranei]
MLSAVRIELERYDWTERRLPFGGDLASVPLGVERLVTATTDAAAKAAYYEYFDNYLIIQGNMFAPAVDLVPALCAALAEDLAPPARYWVLYLIREIVLAEARIEETQAGHFDLPERAQAHARAALWLFYHELCHGVAEWAAHILEEIEPDQARLTHFMAKAKHRLPAGS